MHLVLAWKAQYHFVVLNWQVVKTNEATPLVCTSCHSRFSFEDLDSGSAWQVLDLRQCIADGQLATAVCTLSVALLILSVMLVLHFILITFLLLWALSCCTITTHKSMTGTTSVLSSHVSRSSLGRAFYAVEYHEPILATFSSTYYMQSSAGCITCNLS